MLTLRLARAGTKKRPVYHLVAQDNRARRDGRFVENLGYYVPARKVLVLKQDRIDYWLSVGAQTSSTAKQLIKQGKIHGNTEPQVKPKYEPPAPKPVEKKEEKKVEAKSDDSEEKKDDQPAAEAAPEGEKAEAEKAEAPAEAEKTESEKTDS